MTNEVEYFGFHREYLVEILDSGYILLNTDLFFHFCEHPFEIVNFAFVVDWVFQSSSLSELVDPDQRVRTEDGKV